MQKTIIFLTLLAFILGFVYLGGAFVAMSWNIAAWGDVIRFVAVIGGVMGLRAVVDTALEDE
jgi:hypothetical protein